MCHAWMERLCRKNSFSLTLIEQLLEPDILQTHKNDFIKGRKCFSSTYVSIGYRLPVDKVNCPSLVLEEEYNIMEILFHRSETLTSTPAYKNKHSFTLSTCACKLYFYILVSPCCVTPRSVHQHLTLKRQHNPDWAHSHISAIHYHKNALNMSHNIILNG